MTNSVLVGELLHRAVARRRGVADSVLGMAGLSGRSEMMRQLAEMGFELCAVQLFERPAHSRVQAHAPRPAQGVVGGLSHERVREREATWSAGLLGNQIRRESVVERPDQLILVAPRQALEDVEPEAPPDHRRDRQDVVRVRAECRKTPPDHILHALGHAHRAERAGRHSLLQRPRLGQVLENLLDEERIALRLAHALPGRSARRPLTR